MSALPWIAVVLTLLIFPALFIAVGALNRIEVRLGQLVKPADDAVHDMLHQCFSGTCCAYR